MGKGNARKEIGELFRLAKDAGDQELADRYVSLARKLALRHRISLRQYNNLHCRKCSTYFTTDTLQVRTRPQSVVRTCKNCGNITRTPRVTRRSSSPRKTPSV